MVLKFIQTWIKMFKTLQNDVDNGSFKNKDQQVGATILDSKTWWFSCYICGRDFKDVVNRNQATDPTYWFIFKPFLAYGPAIENMKWATNHAIQDESSYQVDGSTFRNYDVKESRYRINSMMLYDKVSISQL